MTKIIDYGGVHVAGIKAVATSAHNNSVTSGVVTEGTASGDISDDIYYLAEASVTNELFNGTTPATETRTIPAGDNVMWLDGPGSCVLSGGAAGTATEGSPVLFNLGVPTAVTFTYSGSIDRAQCEAGGTPTSFIATNGAAVTRSADEVLYDLAGNFNQSEGTLITKIESFSAFSDIAASSGLVVINNSASGVLYLSSSQDVQSYDGVNVNKISDTSWNAGDEIYMMVRWSDTTNKKQLGIRNVTQSGSWVVTPEGAYAGAFTTDGFIRLLQIYGSIDSSFGFFMLNIYDVDKGLPWIEANY